MKTIQFNYQTLLASLLLVFMSHLGFSQLAFDKAPTPIAKLSLESTTIDYGVVAQNSDGTRTLSFTNTGDAPLVISKVKSSCGCTVPSYSKTPVQPGEKGEVTVSYDTKRLGKFTKTITITSNAEQPVHTFTIKGEVVAN
tara:strand:- start:208 stop:627 length:420 start_codon:yes stop_codon:yes gene_type:complete